VVFAAQNKRLTLYFAGGEEPQDMELAVRAIADGRIDVSGWIGARIGLHGLSNALTTMSAPRHAGAHGGRPESLLIAVSVESPVRTVKPLQRPAAESGAIEIRRRWRS